MRLTIFTLLFVLPQFSFAQVGADFSLRHTLAPAMPIPLGTSFTARLFVKNNSAFPAVAFIFLIPPIPANAPPFDQFVFLPDSITCPSCQEGGGQFCLKTDVILPGDEVACELRVSARTATGNPQRQRWGTTNNGKGVIDPVPGNDETQYELRFIDSLPVPLGSWSYALMSLLLIGVGTAAARRCS